jgi:hypothetical protein
MSAADIKTQAQYASDILYVAAICLAKVSILLLLQRLAVSRLHKRIALATAGIVGAWGLVGIVVLAAQCGSSNSWAPSSPKCINIRSYWVGMAVINVITELVVVFVPVLMMIPVQVAVSKKAVIIAAFIFRACLFYIHPATARSSDATFDAVNYNIVTQCVLSIGITTACIPCLKPFLDGFESGFMGISFKDRMPGGSHSLSHNRDYKMGDLAYAHGGPKPQGKTLNSVEIRSQNYEKDNMSRSEESDYDPRNKMGVSAHVVADAQSHEQRTPRHHRGGDSGSIASSSKSDQMIIKKNVQYTVQYEEPAPARGNERSSSRGQGRQMRDDKSDMDTILGHATSPDEDNRRSAYAV